MDGWMDGSVELVYIELEGISLGIADCRLRIFVTYERYNQVP